MGQLLIIRDEDPRRAGELLERGVALFERLCGLRPLGRLAEGGVAVAGFPRAVKGASAVARSGDGAGWAAACGTWVHPSRSPEDALATLAGRAGDDAEAIRSFAGETDGSWVAAAGGAGGTLAVATDLVGTLHAYRRAVGGSTAVSTSSLVLAALGPVSWAPESVAEFLATGTVFGSRTLFREIEKLEPARVYRMDGRGGDGPRSYWDMARAAEGRAGSGNPVAEMGLALRSALGRVAREYPRAVMDLTGGFDSRALLAAMLAEGLSLGTVVNGPPGHPDVEAADRIARELGLRHRHQAPPADWARRWWSRAQEALPLCDGEYDVLEYARTLDNHLRLAGDFDATLNGSGGEFSKGYWWELLLPLVGRRRPIDERRLAAARFVTDRWSDGLLAEGPGGDALVDHFAGVIRAANRGLEGRRNTTLLDNVYLTLRMQRWHGRIASATNRLWPCLSPFMFREPMEIAFAAPPRARVRNRMTRRVIEHLEPRLSRLPLAGGLPALPLRPTTAHRYLPLARELAGKLVRKALRRGTGPAAPGAAADAGRALGALLAREELRDVLDPKRMHSAALYVPERLERFLERARHAPAGHESHVGRLVTLELLARAISRS